MEKDTFETIEHDIVYTADCFHNYKFAYIEKAAKQYFYDKLRLKNFSEERLLEVMNNSKSKLVEIKEKINNTSEEMKDYSKRINLLKKEVEILKKTKSEKIQVIENLKIEKQALELKNKKLIEIDGLKVNLKVLDEQLEHVMNKIEVKRLKNENVRNEIIRNEISEIKIKKDKLKTKERRWSKVILESYVEDLYCWYSKGTQLIENMIRATCDILEVDTNTVVVDVVANNLKLQLTIFDNKLTEARIGDNIYLEGFENLKQWCIKSDDARLLIVLFIMNY